MVAEKPKWWINNRSSKPMTLGQTKTTLNGYCGIFCGRLIGGIGYRNLMAILIKRQIIKRCALLAVALTIYVKVIMVEIMKQQEETQTEVYRAQHQNVSRTLEQKVNIVPKRLHAGTGVLQQQEGNIFTFLRRLTHPKEILEQQEYIKTAFHRKEHREVVSPFSHDFLILPQHLCDQDTKIVILVHSFHPYHDRREAIRNTWGGAAKGDHPWPEHGHIPSKNIKLFYILGTHPRERYNAMVQEEANMFDDIIVGDFNDSYANLTLKSLLGLRFVEKHCPSAKYLIKTDDDMMIHIPYLLQLLQDQPLERAIVGRVSLNGRVFREGKWALDPKLYPFSKYPPYQLGAVYIITTDIVPELYDMAQYVPRIHVDDAYLTGIIGQMIGVKHFHHSGFPTEQNKPLTGCDMVHWRMIAGTNMTPERINQVWDSYISEPCVLSTLHILTHHTLTV